MQRRAFIKATLISAATVLTGCAPLKRELTTIEPFEGCAPNAPGVDGVNHNCGVAQALPEGLPEPPKTPEDWNPCRVVFQTSDGKYKQLELMVVNDSEIWQKVETMPDYWEDVEVYVDGQFYGHWINTGTNQGIS